MMRAALSILLFFSLQISAAQEQLLLKKDVQSEWLVYSERNLVPYQLNEDAQAIYFYLKPLSFKGDHLVIQSADPYSLFIDGVLITPRINHSIRISIDSLSAILKKDMLFVGVYQPSGIKNSGLSTKIFSRMPVLTTQEEDLPLRKVSGFRDFVVVSVLVLFIFLIVVIYLNPRLSSDYFSFSKIFSMREGDDDQHYFRLTSANILFYVFTSLVLALFFLLVKQFADQRLSFIEHIGNTFSDELFLWVKVSLTILSFFLLKIVLVYTISSLFNLREAAGYHFFNFIRLLLVGACLLTLVMVGYFILHGYESGFYRVSFNTFLVILGAWSVILFLKLSNRMRFSPIHLFSYICATEILPFLIVIKSLYE